MIVLLILSCESVEEAEELLEELEIPGAIVPVETQEQRLQ